VQAVASAGISGFRGLGVRHYIAFNTLAAQAVVLHMLDRTGEKACALTLDFGNRRFIFAGKPLQ
jgi:hypothetical protein